MNIREKIKLDRAGLEEHGAINIVIFGDSVSHGAFTANEFDYEAVYWNILKKKILSLRNYIPVNMICSAIGGATATTSLKRVDSQVLSHSPDLVIVCFGLNDINDELEIYLSSLKEIFKKCTDAGIDTIFMTPNMLNTYVAEDTAPQIIEYAKLTAKIQNEGKMDKYMQSAAELARKMGVCVCDCYSRWKELSKTQDTTLLLANRINHPTKQMHNLFAEMLFETIFGKEHELYKENDSSMYNG